AIDAGRLLPENKQGFITRVKNVAVEENGFLAMQAGAQNQRGRVTGELHLIGLDDNEGINLDRTSFNYDFVDLKVISHALDEILASFFLEVRHRSSEHSAANKIRKTVNAYQSLTKELFKTLEKHQRELSKTKQDADTDYNISTVHSPASVPV